MGDHINDFDLISPPNVQCPNKIIIEIKQPDVTRKERDYLNIQFKPGDVIHIEAGGCVQTDGVGKTWKRYVNPIAKDPNLYHGLIKIHGHPDFDNFQRIADILQERNPIKIPEAKEDNNNKPVYYLSLGYEDDDYTDNGYYGKDEGTDHQCKDEGPAFIKLTIERTLPENTSLVTPHNCLWTAYPLPFDPSSADFPANKEWAKVIAHNQTILEMGGPNWAWKPILDPNNEYDENLVGVSGTVLSSQISPSDLPFTHPFGGDWECFVIPDGPGFEPYGLYDLNPPPNYYDYTPLIGESNIKFPDNPNCRPDKEMGEDDYNKAVTHAKEVCTWLNEPLKAPAGVLGVEFDKGLIPEKYRPAEGDRIAVFGRWIVDCGHCDFHTEIHPPLILVRAQAFPGIKEEDTTKSDLTELAFDTHVSKITHTSIISRPYLVSQDFGDGGVIEHGIKELLKVASIVGSHKIEFNPQLLAKPFKGIHHLTYYVGAPAKRGSPDPDTGHYPELYARYNFITRSGVYVYLSRFDDTTVKVDIDLYEDVYVSPDVPAHTDVNIDMEELSEEAKDVKFWFDTILNIAIERSILTFPTGLAYALFLKSVIDSGIGIRHYDSPSTGAGELGELDIVVDKNRLYPSPNQPKYLVLEDPDPYVFIVSGSGPFDGPRPDRQLKLVTIKEITLNGQLGILTQDRRNVSHEDNDQPFPVYGFLDLYWGGPKQETIEDITPGSGPSKYTKAK